MTQIVFEIHSVIKYIILKVFLKDSFGMWQLSFIGCLFLLLLFTDCLMSQKPPLCNMEHDGQPNYTRLIDSSLPSANRQGVSLFLLLTKPKWCRTNLTSLLTGSLSSSSSLIFYPTHFKCSRGHESYSLLRIHTSGLTNQRLDQPATPLSSPASFLHSSTLTHSVLHNFLWFRLLAIEANVSSLWFKWVFCFFVY